MPITPDLVVYSRKNEPSLVVEVKNKKNASSDWARQFRRNLLLHGGFPSALFFLLVTPDRLFLWREQGRNQDVEPSAEVPTSETFKLFLEVLPSDRLDEVSLELITQAWLSSLADLSLRSEEIAAQHGWIEESGLLEAIRGGHVELDPAA